MHGTLVETGMVAAILAFALSIAAVILAACSKRYVAPALLVVAKRALICNFLLVSLSCMTIIWSFVTIDLSVLYVVNNANSELPMLYRVTALWGAHEGSLLLWLWYLTLFSAIAVVVHWYSHPLSMPYVIAVLAVIQAGFLGFILFLSSPFTEIHPAAAQGRDLNPLLQDPGLAFHPPLLYMGYVGFSVPFAFSIAALLRGQSGREWIVATRRWTLFSWVALTSGILLGGYWAYYELGWGGYWTWDPVENASLLPWLTATAFLHSVMAQEHRNLFQTWNVFLIISTFVLSIIGTFLVRSGILSSVHAFANDPGRGIYILLFLSVISLFSYGLLILRAHRLTGPAAAGNAVSRETALLLNNLVFVTSTAVVLLGTLYPLAVEVVSGERVTVAAPYFNTVMPPLTLLIVLLMAIGPFVNWRYMKTRRLGEVFFAPAVIAVLMTLAFVAAGYRNIVVVIAFMLASFAFGSIVRDVVWQAAARARKTGENPALSMWRQIVRNPRRYGGFVVHLGILVLLFGVVFSAVFRQAETVSLAPGDRMSVGDYILTFRRVEGIQGPNYTARRATIAVVKDGRPVRIIHPEKRSYTGGQAMITTEAAIHTTLSGDLYVVLGSEEDGGNAVIQAFWNPMVVWIWIGWLVMVAGVMIALMHRIPSRYRLVAKEGAIA